MTLSRNQIKLLRAETHRRKLKPVISIGQKGLTDSVHAEIDSALTFHELIKLRIPAGPRADKSQLGHAICERHTASLVESIGNVIVIYRNNPDTDRFAALLGR